MDDELKALSERLAALDERPVAEHPDVLESVHAGLVAELDKLAAKQTPPPS